MLAHEHRVLKLAVALALCVLCATARAAGSIDALATDDPQRLAAAVAQIEGGPADPDALFAAARACEERLLEPARALALYERILRQLPDARVAPAAKRRADALRAEIGAAREHAAEAEEAARLVAASEQLAPDELVHRGDALAATAWPGAPRVAVWLGDWLCRHGRYAEATARYDRAATPAARRAAASCALDAHDWAAADQLAAQLPGDEPADRELRDAILESAERGRARDRWSTLAMLALPLALATLLASLAEAALRKPRRKLVRALRPPIEIAYLAPIATVLVVIAFTAQRLIAPAVLRISLVGLACTWLSGATLDLLRSARRDVRTRALVHVIACGVAVLAVGYLAIIHDGLLDMLSETVRFGPEG